MNLCSNRSSRLFVACLIVFQILCSSIFGQTPRSKVSGNNSLTATDRSRQELDKLRKLGSAYLKKKDWQSASVTFDKALTLRADDPPSLYGKALALFNMQQISAADEILVREIDILSNPADKKLLLDALVLSAVISAVRHNNLEATEKLERAVKIGPTDFDANLSLGRAYFGNGNLTSAVAAFRNAVAILPRHTEARFYLATALEREGSYSEALKQYREILRLDPNNAEGNLGLGVLLLKVDGDNSAEGVATLRKAVALNGNLYEARITLGRTLVKQNKAADAIVHLQKAAALAPNNPEPHFQLSIAYRKRGERDKADAETEIVKKIHENRRDGSEKQLQ